MLVYNQEPGQWRDIVGKAMDLSLIHQTVQPSLSTLFRKIPNLLSNLESRII